MASKPKKKAKTNRISAKQTALNKEYNKQLNRIRKFIKSAEGRGYIFWNKPVQRKNNKRTGESQVVVPTDVDYWALPQRPKRVTEASVNKLKKITTEYLYQRAMYVDIRTGEIFTGSEGVSIENKRRSQKSAETRKKRTRIFTEDAHDYDHYIDEEYELTDYDRRSFWGNVDDDDEDYSDSRYPSPPQGEVYDYILDEIMALLKSLAPSEDRYTKRGKLWAVDESRKTWSNALTRIFLRIQDQESANGTMAEYCDYLVSVADRINYFVDQAKKSSDAAIVAANCEAIMKLLNRGENLQPHEEDALQRYVMGEIDDL